MRALLAVALIIIGCIVLVQLGVGQGGVEGCVKECQHAHCEAAGTELMDCSSNAFRDCAIACRKDGG